MYVSADSTNEFSKNIKSSKYFCGNRKVDPDPGVNLFERKAAGL